jgi:hypothetical protein
MLRLHFLLRLLALTGLLAAGIGALVSATELNSWSHASLRAAVHGEYGQTATIAVGLMLGGLVLAVVIFALDLLFGLRKTAGRRSAVGFNVILQVALALVLVAGVNAWSFSHYRRFDCTEKHQFTLDAQIKEQLQQLRGETTVIVYQQHKMFGRFSDKADRYDTAAERKVVEKVKDLVDLLREVGPQFRVVVLDVEEEGYDRALSEEAAKCPGLEAAIKSAPESSIFFCANNHVQRLGFNEFYQLDKTGSQEAEHGRGNLVLLEQGVEPFARRVLAIEEKRPRVAVAVAHPWLSTEGPIDEYTLAGLRKSLTNYGFDVRDIILKKLVGRRGRGMRLENSALSIEESKFDQLEAQVQPLRFQIARDRQQIALVGELLSLLKSPMPMDEVNAELRKRGLIGRNEAMEEEARKLNIDRLGPQIEDAKRELAAKEEKLKQRERELEQLQTKERVVEGQRASDLKKKLASLLDECDMLIVARMTLRDVGIGDVIPLSLHQIDENQLAAIKEFMKAGKPVLFCVGPNNDAPDPSDAPDRKPTVPSDNLENMLAEAGLVFAPQTVLYDSEADDIAASQAISFGRASAADIPAVDFPEKFTLTGIVQTAGPDVPSNPIAASMRLMKRSAGQPLEVRPRHPRPIYFRSLSGPPHFERVFMATSAASWNEDQPFPTDERPVPRFEPPKADDPGKATLWEKRRGPFPIGIAVETTLPVEWYDPQYGAAKVAELTAAALDHPGGLPLVLAAESFVPTGAFVPASAKGDAKFIAPKKVRLAAIGHGGWFAGPKLSAADETLLLNTTNWLLDRDDRLPRKKDPPWQYPRVELSPNEQLLWRWGTFLGLPGIFAYLGLVVLLVRRMR